MDEKLADREKSDKPCRVIVLMGPAPEEVNDKTKLDSAADRIKCGSNADDKRKGF